MGTFHMQAVTRHLSSITAGTQVVNGIHVMFGQRRRCQLQVKTRFDICQLNSSSGYYSSPLMMGVYRQPFIIMLIYICPLYSYFNYCKWMELVEEWKINHNVQQMDLIQEYKFVGLVFGSNRYGVFHNKIGAAWWRNVYF